MAAPQGPCPLSGEARLTGIESRDDAPPAAWQCGMERGEERKKRFAERSRAKRSFTKAQAGRPWIHAAFAATSVAAHAGAKEHVTHRTINIILQQSVKIRSVAEYC